MRFTLLPLPVAKVGGYAVLVPALGIATQGDTVPEAIAMAQDAIAGYLAALSPTHAAEEVYRRGGRRAPPW